MDDPDSLLQWNMLEMDCPARQLVDDRWVWLPAVLAGRVFTHRVSADESAHDVLTVTPDLDPITTLCEHEQYQRLADGSTARVVLAGYDDELLEERGIPAEAIDPAGALLLMPGTLARARRGRRRHGRFAVDHRRTRPRSGRRHHAAHGRRAAGRDSRRGRTDLRRRGGLDRVRRGPRTVHRSAAAAERDRRGLRSGTPRRVARSQWIRFRPLAIRAPV